MNTNTVSISLLAGLAAAAMTVSAALSPVFALPLGLFSTLPLFVAGFIAGPMAALAAGLGASLLLGLGFGGTAALMFALKQALAPVIISHMAMKSRPASDGTLAEGEVRVQGLEWYPEGRLLLWTAGIAFLILSLQHMIEGEAIRELIRSSLVTRMEAEMASMDATARQVTLEMIEAVSGLAPMFGAAIMVIAIFVNVRLAAAIALASGKSLRPWARFSAMRLPREAGYGLAVAAGLSLVVPGPAGEIALIATAALIAAFFLTGLAFVQGSFQNRNNPQTPKE